MHSVVVFQNHLWVLGGQTLPQLTGSTEAFYADVWSSTDGENWEIQPSNGPSWSARSLAGVAAFNDRLWVLGGGTYNTPTSSRKYLNDVWSSIDGRNWDQVLKLAPWVPRFFHNAIEFDNRLWVFGGSTTGSQSLNDIWLTSDGKSWTQCPSPISPRHAASVTVSGQSLYIMMGAGENVRNDVWRVSRRP